MNAEYPTLSEVLDKHKIQTLWYGQHDGWWECTCQGGEFAIAWTPDHVDVEWREACTIRTAEQVLNLPAGVVLHSNSDGAIELFSDGHWYLPGRRDSISFRRVLENLPAQLIWHPGWAS